ERTPPSMYRRPLMVTGGQMPGTAQLAATASTKATPESFVKTTVSALSASTAGSNIGRSGQDGTGTRAAAAAWRPGSATVSVSSATVPIARCTSSRLAAPAVAAVNR